MYYSYCPKTEENMRKCGIHNEKVSVSKEPTSVWAEGLSFDNDETCTWEL